jgi:hypothetical protein
MVKGNSKTINLLNPKPNPKVHNAFAILSQPNAPTHYNTLSPTPQINDDKTIIPPGPQEHSRQQKMPGASTSNKHYSGYVIVMIYSLTTASTKPRMNAQPLQRTTPTMQSVWQSITPMHNATNQLLGSPNVAKIGLTAWVLHSVEPSKSLTRTIISVLPSKTKYTYSMPLQPLVSC